MPLPSLQQTEPGGMQLKSQSTELFSVQMSEREKRWAWRRSESDVARLRFRERRNAIKRGRIMEE